jgi:hypothetical protein
MAHETIHLGPGDRTRNKFFGHEIKKPSRRALFVGALSVSGALAVGGGGYALSQHHETRMATPVGNAPEAKKQPAVKVGHAAQRLMDLPTPTPAFKDLAPGQTSLAEKHGKYGVLYLQDRTTQVTLATSDGVWEEMWANGVPTEKDGVTCNKTSLVIATTNFEDGQPVTSKDSEPLEIPGSPVCATGKFNLQAADSSGVLPSK